MKKQNNVSMTKLADAAFEQAAKKVVQRAEDSGTSIIVWENESVTKVEPRNARKALKKKKKSGPSGSG